MAVDVLSKQECLDGLTVSIYPHLKVNDRKKIVSDLQKQLRALIDKGEAKLKTYGELVSSLKRQLGGRK